MTEIATLTIKQERDDNLKLKTIEGLTTQNEY